MSKRFLLHTLKHPGPFREDDGCWDTDMFSTTLIKYDENTWRIKIYVDLFIFCFSAINHFVCYFHLFFFSPSFLVLSFFCSPISMCVCVCVEFSGADSRTQFSKCKRQAANVLLEYKAPIIPSNKFEINSPFSCYLFMCVFFPLHFSLIDCTNG